MKEVFLHREYFKLVPVSTNDEDTIRTFPKGKALRAQIYNVNRPRSLAQLNLYWATCQTVADNTEDPQWNTKEKVDFQCRVATNFIHLDRTIVDPHGKVHFQYRSIAFKNLKHIEACEYFDRAFEIMAAKLNVNINQLLENAHA